jgi:hypothetical protein
MGLYWKILGQRMMRRKLKGLPPKVRKKVMRAVVRAGAGIIRKEFKKNLRAHKRTGSLANAVSVKVKLYNYNLVGMVGVRKDVIYASKKGRPIIPGNYNHLLELGRSSFIRVWWNKKQNKRMKQPTFIKAASAKNPLANAIASSKAPVKDKMVSMFKEQIRKEWDKL